jgi:amino acid adenylation domain-containing protein
MKWYPRPGGTPNSRSPHGSDVVSILDRAAERYADRPAVRDSTGRWTWGEVSDTSRDMADGLIRRGVGSGASVLLALAPGRAFVAALFGVLRAGGTVIPVADSATAFELTRLIADAAPALVITDADRARAAAVEAAIAVAAPDQLLRAVPGADQQDVARPRTAPGGFVPSADPDGVALLLYTSGSTGRPKGIVCPHRTVAFAAGAIAARLGYRPDDIVWNRLPLSFDYGLYQIFLCALAGAELVLPGGTASAKELSAIRSAGATVLPLVPTLATLLSRLADRDDRPTRVRLITNTGAALVGADADRIRSALPDASVVCMYGMSEAKRITIADPDEDLRHPGTVGRPLPCTRVFVVDEYGTPLPPEEEGEIVAAGPHVMAGYLGAPHETARRFRPSPDGAGTALFTGDRGRLDADGRLYFVGRTDDLFKRRGWRMTTQELETAMLDIPGVRAAAAAPPDADGTLTVWAVTDLVPRAVLRGLADRLGPAKVPDRCLVLDELPRTTNGKIDRAVLRASLGASR